MNRTWYARSFTLNPPALDQTKLYSYFPPFFAIYSIPPNLEPDHPQVYQLSQFYHLRHKPHWLFLLEHRMGSLSSNNHRHVHSVQGRVWNAKWRNEATVSLSETMSIPAPFICEYHPPLGDTCVCMCLSCFLFSPPAKGWFTAEPSCAFQAKIYIHN